MASKIQLRSDSSANWISANPILAQGEAGIELDTNEIKIGDGLTHWNNLEYLSIDSSIPTASITIKGAVKIGNGLSVTGDGTLSANVQSQIQSDCSQTDNTKPDYIKNQPDLTLKADKSSTYTKTEVDTLIDEIPTPDVSGQITTHNTSNTAHQDIRTTLNNKANVSDIPDVSNFATTSQVDTRIQNIVGTAPAALDTLKEIDDQLSNDESVVAGLVNTISTKANQADLTSGLAEKVDKLGFIATDNNYTTTEKTKLSGIEVGAQVNPDLTSYAQSTDVATALTLKSNLAGGNTFTGNQILDALFIDSLNHKVGIGTTSPSAQLTQKTTSDLETATLGAELLTSSGWTSTDWTGSFAAGWTHTTGNTSALSNSLAAVNGNYYQISYTMTGRTAGNIIVLFGSQTLAVNASGSFTMKATSTSNFSVATTTDFNGTVTFSIKQITAITSPVYAIQDSTGVNSLEIRSGLKTANNTILGNSAGTRITTGTANTFTGYSAGQNTASGVGNTFYGYLAGQNNVSGNSNVFVGGNSGANNTAGLANIFVGYNSGFNNINASNNVYVGNAAGMLNTTGSSNTFIGTSTGYNNTGSSNTFNGYAAGISNTSGGNNCFFGSQVGYSNTTGSNNVCMGINSAQYNATGSNNIMFGTNAGRVLADGTTNNTTCNNSIFLGYGTKAKAQSGTNEIILGFNISGNGSNTTTIGGGGTTNTYIAGQTQAISFASTLQTLTDASNIAWDLSLGGIGSVTLGAAGRTLANPTNIVAGATYKLIVKQDATGSRTITSWGSYFKFSNISPVLKTAANAIDIFEFVAIDTTTLLCVNSLASSSGATYTMSTSGTTLRRVWSDGLIEQWGYATSASDTDIFIAFSIPYTVAPKIFPVNSSSLNAGILGMHAGVNLAAGAISTTGFYARLSPILSKYWYSIGY